jgi:hypothetical protein
MAAAPRRRDGSGGSGAESAAAAAAGASSSSLRVLFLHGLESTPDALEARGKVPGACARPRRRGQQRRACCCASRARCTRQPKPAERPARGKKQRLRYCRAGASASVRVALRRARAAPRPRARAALRAAFQHVSAPDLGTGKVAVHRRNSILACALRLPLLRAAAAAAAAALAAGATGACAPRRRACGQQEHTQPHLVPVM